VTQDQVRTGERLIAGRYVIITEIGRGGMGVVWLAEDRTIGRRVAIKELHLPDDVAPAEKTVFEERVLREARAAGRLNDPGVVTVYDVLRESGTTYIVMELIQATTLSQLVRERGPLPQDVVARLAEQLLSALEVAHAAGVVHRDVKPANIMVLPNGRVKLTDFGIAQSTDDPRLTTSGILVGSPVYMAPERLHGQDADAGSDLWALGAVLFFAVEGYSPFERSSTAATMHAILNEVPYLTRSQGPLAAVITGLLNTHPEARPSAAQVRGLLAQATGTPPAGVTAPVVPGGATLHQPVQGPPRSRKPLLVTAAVTGVALLVAGYFARVATEPGPHVPVDMESTLTYGAGEDGYLKEFTWDSSPDGGCLNSELVEGRLITQSAHVECAEPHSLEVFASRSYYEKPDEDYEEWTDIGYPGFDNLSRFAEGHCTGIFGSEVVPDTSGLRYRALVPTDKAWEHRRTIYCVLYDREGKQMSKSSVE
jgi:eukaryotic-like serine/threonine-protein kinase